MDRCKACRRFLTNEVSKKYGYGPDCLRRAVEQGNAPLESLEQMKKLKQAKPAKANPKADQDPARCEKTMDLFEQAKIGALRLLKSCIAECESLGIQITCTIEDNSK